MKPHRQKNNRKRSAPQWFCVPAAGADAIITANINKIQATECQDTRKRI